MRLLISFLLTLFIYSLFIGLFFYFILSSNQPKEVKQVYIHQAIIKNSKKQIVSKINKPEKKELKKEAKKSEKKDTIKKSEDSFSKAGKDIKSEDIFANVTDNIPTKKIVQKKQNDITIKKGNTDFTKLVKKELANLQLNTSVESNSDEKSKDYISNEFGKIWSEINTQDGNFVTLSVDILNGQLNIVVIATNLDTILLNQFLNKLKTIDISKIKNFSAKITFNTKLKGN